MHIDRPTGIALLILWAGVGFGLAVALVH